MRNRYGGICYRCGLLVEPGAGHFERHNHSWRVQHAACAVEHREHERPSKARRREERAIRFQHAARAVAPSTEETPKS